MTDLDLSQLRLLGDEIRDRYGDVSYEPLAAVSVLWSGWECDSVATLVRLSDGRREIVFVDGTGMPGGLGPEALLEERIVAYETAIRKTRAFLDRLQAERALAVLDRSPDVSPDAGDEVPE
ncbi:hypothetical protein [Mesorhizobium sp. ES1-4]|uniref:hypothetical protein n=1 Tax=Mesorhizobium sp. ES1-4 TaxID=2876627 RepID=UPI001CCD805F|nr:hypothetical protein [Mesorhizobium sp. ES1-4]MBZ9798730.1 hypothetical protein [Mesorhizobium sp. ES1-4]